MNSRLILTATLLPVAAVAAALAPVLRAAVTVADPVAATLAAGTPTNPLPTDAPAVVGEGPVHMSVEADRSVLYADGDRRMRVKLDWWADADADQAQVPTDLVVVLDRSGSMDGDKIEDARAAARGLVDLLGERDRFALVSFSDDARIDLPLGPVRRDQAYRAIDNVQVASSTNMVDGLRRALPLAARTEGRAPRIVLVSDGRPDTADGLVALATRAARSETPLTAIGIGMDYDEALMQSLADAGAGRFHWVQRGPELGQVLASELATGRASVAGGIVARIATSARIVDAGGLPVEGAAIPLGALFAGQHRSAWFTLEVPAGASPQVALGAIEVTYTPTEGETAKLTAALPTVALTHDAAAAFASLDDRWADAVVTDQYNDLKTQVSVAVQRGDEGAARQAIAQYKQSVSSVNAYAANPKVSDNLKDVDQLEQDMLGNFQGENQAVKQNAWAKGTRVDAYSKRRVGIVSPVPAPRP